MMPSEEILTLKEMLRYEKRMRKSMKECSTKTYCKGDVIKQESYNISRLECWRKIKALRLAIKILNKPN